MKSARGSAKGIDMQDVGETTSQRGLNFLQRAFSTEQECLVTQLRSSTRIVHDGDRGEVNEKHFIDLFRHYLPNRYTIDKETILDCDGNVSDSIDLVVFDRQYTPTLLDNDKHRYVPAEAVYAVFECKPTFHKGYLEYAAEKVASVRQLKRTSIPIHYLGGEPKAKDLFPIVGGLLSIDVDWKDGFGETFIQTHKTLAGDRLVDCGFAATGACFDTFDGSGQYAFGPSDNALAFFLFRFLSKLQSLATAPAVDWKKYAKRLSKQEDNK